MAFTVNVHANCNWKTDVVRKDSYVAYSSECHREVGRMMKDLKDREAQAEKLKKTIKLKDLALDTADERIMNWRKETYNQHSILERHAKARRYERYLMFGGGILAGFAAVWAAGQISR